MTVLFVLVTASAVVLSIVCAVALRGWHKALVENAVLQARIAGLLRSSSTVQVER